MIPDVLAARTDLGSTAKWVLSYMDRKAQNRTVKVGLRTLGLLGGKSFQQMSSAVQELERAGEIQIARGRPGQRWSYRLLKPSAMPTLSRSKTVRHADGASAMPTEASAMPTRMIQRPSETKKNPPTPQGGREGSALSRNGQQSEGQQSVAEANTYLDTRGAVVALFYPSGVPSTQRRSVDRLVNDLVTLAATAEQVRSHHRRWPDVFPNAGACTLKSLVKHWDVLAPPAPNPYLGETEDDADGDE